MSKLAVRTTALMAFVLLTPLVSAAQTGGEVRRPYRALFGGDPNDATSSSVSVSFSGGYDDNVFPKDNAALDPRFQSSSFVGGVGANLTLQRATERTSLGLALSSSLRYIHADDEVTSSGHGLNAFARRQLGDRMSVRLVGGFLWAPLYNPLLSGAGIGTEGFESFSPPRIGADYSVGSRPAMFANGSVTVDYSLTRRASLSGSYSAHYGNFTDEDRQHTANAFRAGAGYRLTRYSSLRLSYSRVTHSLADGEERGDIDDFGGGIDYRRPWSLSGRRTTLTVTPGMALDRRGGSTRVHVTGSASLDHEIGRTWTARASYRRGFRYADGLGVQVLADTAQGVVEGLLSRRVSLAFDGQLVISGDQERQASREYHAYGVASRISYALTRHLSCYAQYVYYSYRYGDSVVVPVSIGRRLDRQGIRVGLSVWAPVLR